MTNMLIAACFLVAGIALTRTVSTGRAMWIATAWVSYAHFIFKALDELLP